MRREFRENGFRVVRGVNGYFLDTLASDDEFKARGREDGSHEAFAGGSMLCGTNFARGNHFDTWNTFQNPYYLRGSFGKGGVTFSAGF